MREMILKWITDLTMFSFLSSVCIKLLPGKGYAPYMRLFAGIVLLLLFVNPLLQYTGFDDSIAVQMEEYMEEARMSLMEKRIFEVEERQREKIKEAWKESSSNPGDEN